LGRQSLRGWKVLDVDGDGRTDLVYVRCAGGSASTCLVEVEVLFAGVNGTWTLAFPQRFNLPGVQAGAMPIAGDVDGDGRTDLVWVLNGLLAGTPGSGVRLQALMATGSTATPAASRFVTAFAAAPQQGPFAGTGEDSSVWRPMDVDGDGSIDLLHLARTRPPAPAPWGFNTTPTATCRW
jgi:hypothetical protein